MAGIVDLVIRPDTFFARVSKEKTSLVPPLAIFGTGTLLPVLVYLIAVAYYSLVLSSGSFMMTVLAMMRIFLVCNIGLPLAGWALMSLWTWAISRSLGGKGSLAASVRDTGYGMMPWTLSVVAFMLFSGVLFIAGYAVPGTVSTLEAYAPAGYGAFAFLSLLVLIWEWYLWALAAMHTHGFSFRKSAAITGIPVALYLIVMIFTMISPDAIRTITTG